MGTGVFTLGQLFKTTNGGSSWNTVPSMPGGYEIQFTSNDIGWMMAESANLSSYKRLYRTTDGGDNWEIILSGNSDTTFLSMYFINDSIGWLSTFPAQVIFHTTDGEISWERFEAPSI